MSRTLFIGDVHGCRHELAELIARFRYRPGDRLFQVGDLINKGPDSIGAVRYVQEMGIQCVKGNHEAKLLKVWNKPESERSPKEKRLLDKVGDPEWICSVIQDWPLWHDTGTELVVHAGLEPGKRTLEEMNEKVVLTVRTWDGAGDILESPDDPPWFDCITWPRTVIFGHWAMGGLVDTPHVKGLDTGCVYGKLLTGWCPEENRFYQVPAACEYASMKRT
jgi:hypothetical protein